MRSRVINSEMSPRRASPLCRASPSSYKRYLTFASLVKYGINLRDKRQLVFKHKCLDDNNNLQLFRNSYLRNNNLMKDKCASLYCIYKFLL